MPAMRILILLIVISAALMTTACDSGDMSINVPIKASRVGGYIDSSMTWTLEMSPFLVEFPVIVSSGAVLTIDPGVEVSMAWKMGIAVFGSLIAEGTPESPIHFTGHEGVWNGLSFNGRDQDSLSSLKYCTIEYCNLGVLCDTLTSPTIEKCTIRNFTHVGVYVGNQAQPQIIDNDILNPTPGGFPTGIQCDPFSNPWIYGNRITGHSKGVYCLYVSFTVIDSNTIADCDTGFAGLYTANTVTVRNSQIIGNDVGFGLWLSSPEITDNVITGNEKAIQGINESNRYLRRNDFSDNTWTYYNLSINRVDAEQNWWGTTDSTVIADGIWDQLDSTGVGAVDFIPTLPSPPE